MLPKKIINIFTYNANWKTRQQATTQLATTLLATSLQWGCISVSASEQLDQVNSSFVNKEPITPIPQKVSVDEHKAKLGEALFHDTRLSLNKDTSCASCHQLEAGGDDNMAKGISQIAGKHVINTPSIFNARYNFRQNWDGSARSLQEQIEMVVGGHREFNNNWDNIVSILESDMQIRDDFNDNYQDGITVNNIIDAIVEFENTLVTPNARFDRYLRNEENALTPEEITGYKLFKELGCVSCHQGMNIGGNLYQKFGVFYDYIAERGDITRQDYGKFNVTNRQIDKFVFKVPSLRNVAVTAPYLHDGSAETLEEVIEIMGKTQLGRTLSDDEILSIKSFLNTLTGEYRNKLLDAKS